MSAGVERAKTAAAVAELGALPMPVGPGPLPVVESWLGCIRCRGEKAREYLKNGGLRGGCPACGLDNDGACGSCRHRHDVGVVCGTAIGVGGSVRVRRCQCTGPESGGGR